GPGGEGGGAGRCAVLSFGEYLTGAPDAASVRSSTSILSSSGNFGSGMWFAFNNFNLPLFLDPLDMPAPGIGVLASGRSVERAFIQPIVGGWSDRTWTTGLGRCRVFIAAFVPLCAAFVLLTPVLSGWASVGPFIALGSALGLANEHTH